MILTDASGWQWLYSPEAAWGDGFPLRAPGLAGTQRHPPMQATSAPLMTTPSHLLVQTSAAQHTEQHATERSGERAQWHSGTAAVESAVLIADPQISQQAFAWPPRAEPTGACSCGASSPCPRPWNVEQASVGAGTVSPGPPEPSPLSPSEARVWPSHPHPSTPSSYPTPPPRPSSSASAAEPPRPPGPPRADRRSLHTREHKLGSILESPGHQARRTHSKVLRHG